MQIIENAVYMGAATPGQGGGSAPVIDTLNVTPTTSAQTITAPEGTDGYSPVNVSAVTSAIDANITAGNIKKDVSILGVTGSYEGVAPSGTKNITTNGIHDVAGYANADVQVPTTAPEIYRAFRVNNGMLENSVSTPFMPLPSSTTDISAHLLCQCYKNTPSNILSGAVDLSSLTSISGSYACNEMFSGCTGVTSVDLSGLTTVSGTRSCEKMFSGCTGVTSFDLSSLTTIAGSYTCNEMFKDNTSISGNLDLSSITSISGSGYECLSMFEGCTGITSVDFSGLTAMSGGNDCVAMFKNCTSLRTVNLSSLATMKIVSGNVPNMFNNCTSLERVFLSDEMVKRNPPHIMADVPIKYCEYADKLEYVASTESAYLCWKNKFPSANMKNFEMISVNCRNMFADNPNLVDLKLPVLTRWSTNSSAQEFLKGCTNANFTDLYFPMLCVFRNTTPFITNSFPGQLTVHFRKDQQATIMAMSGASSSFSAAALVFDLIGTITVSGVDYIRQGKCNETGYYAWQKNTANITVGGVVYTFDIVEMTRNTVPDQKGPILYGWKNGSTVIYTDSLKPQVGDYIWTAYNVAQSTTPIDAVDNEFVYTVDSAEPDVGDTVYSDAQGTVLGTISAVA